AAFHASALPVLPVDAPGVEFPDPFVHHQGVVGGRVLDRWSILSLARRGTASGYTPRCHSCAAGRVFYSGYREGTRRAAGSNRHFGFLCWIRSSFISLPASPWRARCSW